jgi:hypothetical protein
VGFTPAFAALLTANKKLISGKTVLSLGNPFGAETVFRQYLEASEISKISAQPRDVRARYLFTEIFQAADFKILDISSEEGANYVADLNHAITQDELKKAFQVVLDLGTQEHVFNEMTFLENVFDILSSDGTYIFDLPANNCCEHGFRQYSPTFFYDLCASNYSWLKINHLSLWSTGIYLNTLPVYEKLDPSFCEIAKPATINMPPRMISSGIFTGTSVALFNKINCPTGVIGVITKTNASHQELNLAAIQTLYRKLPLSSVLPNAQPRQSLMQAFKQDSRGFAKKVLINLPARFTIKALALVARKFTKR